MIRSLKLSQRQSIFLAKDLKQTNILAVDVRIYGAINRFTNFFKSIENNSLAYCTDIRGLILTMQNEYNPEHWRLFINSSKSSLKGVLLHQFKKFHSDCTEHQYKRDICIAKKNHRFSAI